MVLEYCDHGPLRTWLKTLNGQATDSSIDALFRIVYGVTKGMEYLHSKKVISYFLVEHLLNRTFKCFQLNNSIKTTFGSRKHNIGILS